MYQNSVVYSKDVTRLSRVSQHELNKYKDCASDMYSPLEDLLQVDRNGDITEQKAEYYIDASVESIDRFMLSTADTLEFQDMHCSLQVHVTKTLPLFYKPAHDNFWVLYNQLVLGVLYQVIVTSTEITFIRNSMVVAKITGEVPASMCQYFQSRQQNKQQFQVSSKMKVEILAGAHKTSELDAVFSSDGRKILRFGGLAVVSSALTTTLV